MERDGLVHVVEPYRLGPAVLPTGKVVGCDPLIPHTTPYVDAVQPGRYDLVAWMTAIHKNGVEWQRRIAALQLVVADTPAAFWAMALLPDQDLASLGGDEFFGYSVDFGTATLADQPRSRRSTTGTTTSSTRCSSRRRYRTTRSRP